MSGNAIEIERLSFTYDGEREPALRNLSLTIGEGQMVARRDGLVLARYLL